MNAIQLQPWAEEDLSLLEKLLGDPEMMTHLGGPETPEQILHRHQRYLHLPEDGTDHMFRIVWGPQREGVGNVGYWRKTWRDQAVYEIGWLITAMSFHPDPSAVVRGHTSFQWLERGAFLLQRSEVPNTDPAEHGVRIISPEDVQAPALYRLYRAIAHEHWVLDPTGRPDLRTPVNL